MHSTIPVADMTVIVYVLPSEETVTGLVELPESRFPSGPKLNTDPPVQLICESIVRVSSAPLELTSIIWYDV